MTSSSWGGSMRRQAVRMRVASASRCRALRDPRSAAHLVQQNVVLRDGLDQDLLSLPRREAHGDQLGIRQLWHGRPNRHNASRAIRQGPRVVSSSARRRAGVPSGCRSRWTRARPAVLARVYCTLGRQLGTLRPPPDLAAPRTHILNAGDGVVEVAEHVVQVVQAVDGRHGRRAGSCAAARAPPRIAGTSWPGTLSAPWPARSGGRRAPRRAARRRVPSPAVGDASRERKIGAKTPALTQVDSPP